MLAYGRRAPVPRKRGDVCRRSGKRQRRHERTLRTAWLNAVRTFPAWQVSALIKARECEPFYACGVTNHLASTVHPLPSPEIAGNEVFLADVTASRFTLPSGHVQQRQRFQRHTGLAPVNRHQRPLLLIKPARIPLRHLRHTAPGIRHDAAPDRADAVSRYCRQYSASKAAVLLAMFIPRERFANTGVILCRPRRLHRRMRAARRAVQTARLPPAAGTPRLYPAVGFKARSIMTVELIKTCAALLTYSPRGSYPSTRYKLVSGHQYAVVRKRYQYWREIPIAEGEAALIHGASSASACSHCRASPKYPTIVGFWLRLLPPAIPAT